MPLLVKTTKEQEILIEDPTDIHKVTLLQIGPPRPAPAPIRAVVQPKQEKVFPWWWLLPLLCCLPLLCLPCVWCCKKKAAYVPSSYSKPHRATMPDSKSEHKEDKMEAY